MKTDSPTINAAALIMDRGAPSRTAVACGERTLSWSELRVAVARAGAAWLDCGVARGETVQLHLPRDIDHAIAYLGAVWAGAVPVPLARDGVATRGQPWDEQAPCRFILARTREGYADRWRDSVMTLAEWRMYVDESGMAPPRPMRADAAACWTEPRTRDGSGARLLTHAFASVAPPMPARLRGGAVTSTMLGMLKVLRRGGTAMLCAPAPSRSAARATEPAL